MKYLDLRSRFLLVTNPLSIGFWNKVRMVIASWIYPPFATKRDDWTKHYFTHEYMLHVHQYYDNERRALNKSLLKKDKKLKELLKLLKENPI